jgi:hypothetical protein
MFKAEVEAGGKHVASEVNRRRIIHRAKMKSLRISVVIVVAFIVCWTPYYIMMIIFMFLNPDEHVSNFTLTYTNFLLSLSRKMKLSGYQDVSAGTATTLWAGRRGNLGSIPGRYKRFFSPPQRPGRLWALPSLLPMGTV